MILRVTGLAFFRIATRFMTSTLFAIILVIRADFRTFTPLKKVLISKYLRIHTLVLFLDVQMLWPLQAASYVEGGAVS